MHKYNASNNAHHPSLSARTRTRPLPDFPDGRARALRRRFRFGRAEERRRELGLEDPSRSRGEGVRVVRLGKPGGFLGRSWPLPILLRFQDVDVVSLSPFCILRSATFASGNVSLIIMCISCFFWCFYLNSSFAFYLFLC